MSKGGLSIYGLGGSSTRGTQAKSDDPQRRAQNFRSVMKGVQNFGLQGGAKKFGLNNFF